MRGMTCPPGGYLNTCPDCSDGLCERCGEDLSRIFFTHGVCKVARPGRFELPTYGLEDKTLELPNLLKSLEALEIMRCDSGTLFPEFTYFGTFRRVFLTRILTQRDVATTSIPTIKSAVRSSWRSLVFRMD
jgi:hypothetical protein